MMSGADIGNMCHKVKIYKRLQEFVVVSTALHHIT